jgi:hypothetical protein
VLRAAVGTATTGGGTGLRRRLRSADGRGAAEVQGLRSTPIGARAISARGLVRLHRSGDAEMAATSTLVAAAAIITLVALTTRAEAQSLSPYYGPDGRVYYRRADPAIPQQPYAAPQTVPAPTTTAPAPRAQKVKVKPKPKPKPDTPKPAVVAAPEPTVAVPAIKADPPAPSPIEPKEVKPHPLAEWCGQEGNAKAPLCRNLGSSRVQR